MKYITSLLLVALFSTSVLASAGMHDLMGSVKLYRAQEKAFFLEVKYDKRYGSLAACNAVKAAIEQTPAREFESNSVYSKAPQGIFGDALDSYLQTNGVPLFKEYGVQRTQMVSKFTHLDCYPASLIP